MRTRVIAEIGINHDGNLEKARLLVKHAHASGCYGIKFQYRNLKNSYSQSNREIGDEIILSEIVRNYISPDDLILVAREAKALGLKAGISFFTSEDISDFDITEFDFFKIPSVELTNIQLIKNLLNTEKEVLISLGMHSEIEIEQVLSEISDYTNWVPLHCVSNYPVVNHNAQLGYITYLQNKWGRMVGYSSHDDNWENIGIALSLGATIIERHITDSRKSEGLDHSSSSTLEEFQRICKLANDIDALLLGNGPRVPNQGELLNRQNLGRSPFARRDIDAGEVISVDDFEYRGPLTGITGLEFKAALGNKLLVPIKKNTPITRSHIQNLEFNLTFQEIELAKQMKLSIPIRVGDFKAIQTSIPIGKFEFHLSFQEIASDLSRIEIDSEDTYSVHLPDYIDSRNLVDPWSKDGYIRELSVELLNRTIQFADRIGSETRKVVPIVASLSCPPDDVEIFYDRCSKLFKDHQGKNSLLTLQWLPPIAWYFGGSINLHVMNNLNAVEKIKELDLPITMDYSHLILGRNYFGFDAEHVLETLFPQIKHIHVCDAKGIDGEGMQIGEGDPGNLDLIRTISKFSTLKVIEVWQGHLNHFWAFKKAISKLVQLEESK